MARWPIVGQLTIEADTPDEAIARLRGELARGLEPGEGGSPWREYGRALPSGVVGSVREVSLGPSVPLGRRGATRGGAARTVARRPRRGVHVPRTPRRTGAGRGRYAPGGR